MRILIIDHKKEPAGVLAELLRARGHEPAVFTDEARALEAFAREAYPAVFLGGGLGRSAALYLCGRLRALPEAQWTLIWVAGVDARAESLDDYLEAGADDFIGDLKDRPALEARLRIAERQAEAHARARHSELSLRERLEMEQLVVSISNRFVHVEAEEIDHAVHEALRAIGEYAGVDRANVTIYSDDLTEASITHEWCAPGVASSMAKFQNVPVGPFQWGLDILKKFQPLQLPGPDGLPEAAAPIGRLMETLGVKSCVIVPMALGGTLRGVLTFNSLNENKLWADEDIRLLKMVGESLIHALERRRSEEALMRGEERFRRLAENAADAFFVYDLEGRILDLNQRACEMLGYTRGELLGMNMEQIEENPVLGRIAHSWRETSGGPVTVEGVHRAKDGRRFPVEARVGYYEEGGKSFTLALVRDISQRRRAEERLLTLNEVFIGLAPDFDKNIQRLTEACGTLLRATCALYSRVEGGELHSAGRWQTPPDFNPVDKPEGHICHDVIKAGREAGVRVLRRLRESAYAKTDPHVARYGLQTYVGHAVARDGQSVGSLCVVYDRDFVPDEADKRLLEIFAMAVGVEEERREAALRLQASEERFRQLAESIEEVFWLSDPEKNAILYVSPGYERIWGRSTESLYRSPRSWLDSIHPDDRERVFRAAITKQVAGKYDEEYRILRADGAVRWVRDRAFPIKDKAGRVYRIAGIAEDITGQKRMESEILEISGREQARLGRELHDGLGHALSAAAHLVEKTRAELGGKSPAAAALGKIADLAREALERTRAFGKELYPVGLEKGGLAAALQEMARRLEGVYGVPCRVETDGKPLLFDLETQTQLFRIGQEALVNAFKHGKARAVNVRLASEDDKTVLSIADDGVGVPADFAERSGLGLRIMNYRAKSIGATLSFSRPASGGTTVACSLYHLGGRQN